MILSSWSTTSIEEVAAASGPRGLRWFQLYVYNDKEVTRGLIKRAEQAGYKALVVTVDTPVLGKRLADARNCFSLPSHLTLANFDNSADASSLKVKEGESSLLRYTQALIDPGLTWETIRWVQGVTRLPVLVKGVLTAEDAIEAVQHGVHGIVVSNHGARQLDGSPATVCELRDEICVIILSSSLFFPAPPLLPSPSLSFSLPLSHSPSFPLSLSLLTVQIDALSEVVKAVDGKVDVFMDGGVRQGTDVLKALALGAKAVFVGRPVLWGLAYKGQEGVEDVLNILKDEFKHAMMLSGVCLDQFYICM